MSHITDSVFSQLDGHPCTGLIVAYSGGLDSTLLLHLAHLYCTARPADNPLHLRALHIDHGDAFNTEVSYTEHCQSWCQKQGIECTVETVMIKPQAGKSLEQLARDARYAVFTRQLKEGEALLMAHHQDDQIETLLLRLNRSSGMRGLSGIPKQRSLGKGTILRPLLTIERQQIQALAQHCKLQWQEDPSNSDTAIDRNYLRHEILSRLKKRWSDIGNRWQASMTLLAEQNQAMDWLCASQLTALLTEQGNLSIAGMSQYPSHVQGQLIIAWLGQQGIEPPSKKILNSIMQQMHGHAQIDIPQQQGDKVCLRAYRQQLYLIKGEPATITTPVYQWQPQQPLVLPHGTLQTHPVEKGGIALPKHAWTVTFRAFRSEKDAIQLLGRQHHTGLKNLFQQLAVPPWQRPYLPLIFADDELIAVADMAVSELAKAESGGVVIQWQEITF